MVCRRSDFDRNFVDHDKAGANIDDEKFYIFLGIHVHLETILKPPGADYE